jgi:hypothetical protein
MVSSSTSAVNRVRMVQRCLLCLCFIHYFTMSALEMMFCSSLSPVVCRRAHVLLMLFVGRLMSYWYYLCLFVYSDVQHIFCCVFLRLVYPMLPVSLDCPFLIAPSIFSNVYLAKLWLVWHCRINTIYRIQTNNCKRLYYELMSYDVTALQFQIHCI